VSEHIHHAGLKFWAAIGIIFTLDFLTTAGKVAGSMLSIALFLEWVWKRLIRPKVRAKRDALASTAPGDLKDD